MRNSRVPGFYKLPLSARHQELARLAGLSDEEIALLGTGCLSPDAADHMIENVVGTYALPMGVGLNFVVNGKDYLVPMCVEEPSVVAAASNAARMVREGGGFVAEADAPVMIAQVQILDVADTTRGVESVLAEKASIMAACDAVQPMLVSLGGGSRDVEVRILEREGQGQKGMLVVHLLVDCRDAMGANMVNTMAESVAPRLAALAGGRPGLRILSNLADHRLVRVRCKVPAQALSSESFDGATVCDGIVSASRFAELDPYRAATHNKGIMNGIDPVVIATGNDWRGVEAGAHSFAARDGRYRPLAVWRKGAEGELIGAIELPMALGTVGGTLRAHPGARLGLKLIAAKTAVELAMVATSVGLASNLAALRALACEGIQRGHMTLHARSVALSAGATGDMVDRVAAEMARSGEIRADRAEAILQRLLSEAVRKSGSVDQRLS